MTREEILAKSRSENKKNNDEFERSILNSAGKIAVQIGILLCCAINVIQILLTDHINFTSWVIYFGILCTLFLVKYVKLRQRHELFITILFGGFFLFFSVLFILDLVLR